MNFKLPTLLFSTVLTGCLAIGAAADAQYVEKAPRRVTQSTARSAATVGQRNEKQDDFMRRVPKKKRNSSHSTLTRASKGLTSRLTNPRPAMSPMMAPANMPSMNGMLTYSTLWGESMASYGIYTVPVSDASSFDEVFPIDESYAGIALDGVYYATDFFSVQGMTFLSVSGYDLESGEKIFNFEPQSYDCIPLCLAADSKNHEIYGVFYDSDGMGIEFGTITYDEDAYERTVIAPLDYTEGMWNSLAISGNGTIYGIRMTQNSTGTTTKSELCTIDRYDGHVTVIGDTGELPQYMSAAVIDPNTDKMYWTVSPSDGTGYICEVNLATGRATQLYRFPHDEEVVGLYLTSMGINPKAPGEIQSLTADFTDDSLSGNINITAPKLLYDGLPGIGKVTIKVELDGEVIAEQTGNYGAKFTVPVTLEKPGRYNFTAYAENSVAAGPKSLVSCPWLGPDTPSDPSVTAVYNNGQMTLTWNAVTTSQHNGFVDPAKITYNIYDGKGNSIANGLTATTYTFALQEPDDLTIYSYRVKAAYAGYESEGGISNDIVLGTITPPYTPNFEETKLEGWTVIDGDNDGKSWDYNSMTNGIYAGYCANSREDDWLLTPPVKMEAGKAYTLDFDLWSLGKSFTERLEVKMGKENTKQGMTTVVMEPMQFNNGSFESDRIKISRQIVCQESGTYYIGFHACSDQDQYGININNLTLGEGVSLLAPDAVTDLTVTPDPDGATKATVTLTTPAKTMDGNELTSISRVEVMRDGELVHTFNSPAVGSQISFEDVMSAEGQVHYSVAAYNNYGKGVPTHLTTWIGIGRPAAAQNPTIARTANVGEVNLTWLPIGFNTHGVAINPDKVTYNVYRFSGGEGTLIQEGIKDTNFTFKPVAATEQEFVECAIYGQTTAGQGTPSYTDLIPVGKPYAGFEESGQLDFIIGTENTDNAEWAIQDDSYDEGGNMKSQDGDNLFFCCYCNKKGDEASIFTGLIDLSSFTAPGLSFFLFNNYDGEKDLVNSNEFKVEVLVDGENEWQQIANATIDELCNSSREKWSQCTYNLEKFAGKTIQLRFTVKTMSFTSTALDNIRVANLFSHDLRTAEVTAPEKVTTGESYNADVKIANVGLEAATGYTIELYADGKLIDSKAGEEIAPGEIKTVTFTETMSPAQAKALSLQARVDYSADMDMDNNLSSNVRITPTYSNLPAVSDLKGNNLPGSIDLNWTAPEIEANDNQPYTEDFENAESFADSVNGWIFIDKDNRPVGGMSQVTWPGITPGYTKGSFWVWDLSTVEATGVDSHSGDKMLFSVYATDDGMVDDWAISPRLNGKAQTIKFFARSYTKSYPEKIEVYYTTKYSDNLTPDDFTIISSATVNAVPAEWTEYSVDLPEGATRFAIRTCATGGYLLLVDDVTYIPGNAASGATLKGYDLYRNSVKMNEAMLSGNSFNDTNLTNGEAYDYVVVAVYDKGVSAPSNVAHIVYSESGVDGITSDVKVFVRNGSIVIRDAAGLRLTVSDVDGKLLYNGIGKAETVIPALQGVYAVKIAGRPAVKVIIR